MYNEDHAILRQGFLFKGYVHNMSKEDFFNILLFYTYILPISDIHFYFVCVCVRYAVCMQVPVETRRGSQISGTVNNPRWVLGTELRSSGRVGSTLND